MSELKYSIHPSEITLLRKVGGGNFGEVWEADYIGTRVAVKRLLAVDEEDLEIYIERELSTLRGVFHPHIVQLMGIVRHGKDVFIITEYVAGGSLRSILKDESIPLSWARRLSFATDIALAMAYLHHRNILHRDLKSANLLVDEAWRVKVCDFGLARKMPSSAHEAKHLSVVGTDEWMAPEMLLEEEYDRSADVFSFAMVLWELITRKRPPERLAESEFAFDFEKFKKKIPKDTPKMLWELFSECAAYEPQKRPTFKATLERLSKIFLELQNAAVCVEEQPTEAERREAEEKERKKRKEHMKVIKQVEGGAAASPRHHQPAQPQQQPQQQQQQQQQHEEAEAEKKGSGDEKNEKRKSGEKDDKKLDEKNEKRKSGEKDDKKLDEKEKRKSGEKDDKKLDDKSSSQERKLEKVVSQQDKKEEAGENNKKKEKERKKSLTKEAAENILNAIKGSSPEKDLRKELKKANSKDKELNKLKRQVSKDSNLHGDANTISSPRTNKKKEKEKEKEKDKEKEEGKSKEQVSSPKATRKSDEKRATLTKSTTKEKPVSEKKKKTHHQEITDEEEVETRSFIKNGQEKIKIKKTIKFPFTRSQSIFLTCGVPKRKNWGADDPVEIDVKVENNSSKTIKQIQVFLQRTDQGKAPKEKDVKAKALREKTEKSFESTAAGLPLEAWQVLKTTLDYSLPSKDVLRAFAEDDAANQSPSASSNSSSESLPVPENGEDTDVGYELVVKVSLSRGDDVPKLFTRIGMSPLFAYIPLSIVY